MYKLMIWVWWKIWYFFTGRPTNLADYLISAKRLIRPYKKFKPCVYYNEVGEYYTVYWADELAYSEIIKLELVCHISDKTGQIIGLDFPKQNAPIRTNIS